MSDNRLQLTVTADLGDRTTIKVMRIIELAPEDLSKEHLQPLVDIAHAEFRNAKKLRLRVSGYHLGHKPFAVPAKLCGTCHVWQGPADKPVISSDNEVICRSCAKVSA